VSLPASWDRSATCIRVPGAPAPRSTRIRAVSAPPGPSARGVASRSSEARWTTELVSDVRRTMGETARLAQEIAAVKQLAARMERELGQVKTTLRALELRLDRERPR